MTHRAASAVVVAEHLIQREVNAAHVRTRLLRVGKRQVDEEAAADSSRSSNVA